MRVIVPENEESRDRIIFATNNQTAIPKSSLRANDPIHWQIELFFKGHNLYYDRRKNYYKNQGIKSSDIISVSFLAQCMITLLLQKPNYARARPSTLLTDDEAYNSLYNNQYDMDVFYNAAFIGRTVERILKKSTTYSRGEMNDILFYVIYYIVAEKSHSATITATNVKNMYFETIDEAEVLRAAEIVYKEYATLGGTGKVAKGSELIEKLKNRISISGKIS